MTPDPLLRPLESLLNRNIAGSSRARGLLAQVAGKSLEIRVTATPFRVRIQATDERIAIAPGGDAAADATIEGTPLSLARLAAPDTAQAFRSGGLRISGDAEIAQGFQKLFAAARPDFEEELSRVTGDAFAHHVASLAHSAVRFGLKARDTFTQNVAEYLTEEGRDVPVQFEVEEFLTGVDAVREATDRLEARIEQLERPRTRN
ncbi:MAG: SCP2 sterol-binding domain-containing protein [Gammaproteobacteria bacterium]|nr:SCP2 sterol-binding domain-containing protein [Gammaproteobacteria bacterium]